MIDSKLVLPIVAIVLTFFASCHPESERIIEKEHFEYLFLGHTYQTENTIDDRLLDIDFNYYDQIWLGGDICSETTKDYETLNYLDDLFDLSNPTTHWTLGNHDVRNGNIHWITEKTERPTFYTTSFNGICLIVLNTNLDFNNIYDTIQLNKQFDLIQNVSDTIQQSSHLIILSHAVMWRNIEGLENVSDAANAEFSYKLVRIAPNQRFHDGIYPLFQQVAARGIKVINIAGDFGQKQMGFEAVTPDNIYFLGSGITSETEYNEQFPTHGKPDKVLILKHNEETKEITWQFVRI